MNESVLRSPKWMRNFLDFEITTGEDIKGEPSEKRKRQMEMERLEKEEQERKEREEREEKEKLEKEKLEKEKFNKLFDDVINFIYKNYKICKISIPRDNYLTIEMDGLNINNINLEFKISLDNTSYMPKFDVYMKFGNKNYDYIVTGLIYVHFKNLILDEIYEWYRRYGSKQQFKQESTKQTPKQETKQKTPIENKKRRYNLLKDTLEGYERQLKNILDWERKNPGKKHTDKDSIKNEISNLKDKINQMNNLFHFESYYFKHLNSFYKN